MGRMGREASGFYTALRGLNELPAEQCVDRFLNTALTLCSLQALRRCHLKHNIALWQLLSTRKSEQLLCLRRVRNRGLQCLLGCSLFSK